MTTVLDKVSLKKSLKELVINEPEYVNELIHELGDDLKKLKKQRLEEIIQEDFNEYAEVFNALA